MYIRYIVISETFDTDCPVTVRLSGLEAKSNSAAFNSAANSAAHLYDDKCVRHVHDGSGIRARL